MGMRLGSIGSGRARRSRPRWCRPLRYLSNPKPPVALVSFPGSGNTWLRYLLQQATGKTETKGGQKQLDSYCLLVI